MKKKIYFILLFLLVILTILLLINISNDKNPIKKAEKISNLKIDNANRVDSLLDESYFNGDSEFKVMINLTEKDIGSIEDQIKRDGSYKPLPINDDSENLYILIDEHIYTYLSIDLKRKYKLDSLINKIDNNVITSINGYYYLKFDDKVLDLVILNRSEKIILVYRVII